jgi:hypothetical protein
VETYTDNEGRTVLERRIHTDTKGTEHLDTYYVYDDLNRLRYVLPPAGRRNIPAGRRNPFRK